MKNTLDSVFFAQLFVPQASQIALIAKANLKFALRFLRRERLRNGDFYAESGSFQTIKRYQIFPVHTRKKGRKVPFFLLIRYFIDTGVPTGNDPCEP